MLNLDNLPKEGWMLFDTICILHYSFEVRVTMEWSCEIKANYFLLILTAWNFVETTAYFKKLMRGVKILLLKWIFYRCTFKCVTVFHISYSSQLVVRRCAHLKYQHKINGFPKTIYVQWVRAASSHFPSIWASINQEFCRADFKGTL